MNRLRLLIPVLATVIVAAVVALFVATSGGTTTPAQSQAHSESQSLAGSAVSVGRTSLGPTLVDATGRTLYLFEGDRPNRSTLSAAGLAIWPAFTPADTPRALNGAVASEIGRIAGSGQVTYGGHPLYYHVGDQMPGQTGRG